MTNSNELNAHRDGHISTAKARPLALVLLAGVALALGACGSEEPIDFQGSSASLTEEDAGVAIEITSPNHGEFWERTTWGPSKPTIEGKVTGVEGLDFEVTVNGKPASISHSGGDMATWSTKVDVSSADIFNNIIAEVNVPDRGYTRRDLVTLVVGSSVDEVDLAERGFGLRLSERAFDKVEASVVHYLPKNLSEVVPTGRVPFIDPNKPLYEQSVDNILRDHYLDLKIADVSSSGVSVDLQPGSGLIDASASISDVFVRVSFAVGERAFDSPGIDQYGIPVCTVDLSIDEVTLTGQFSVYPSSGLLMKVEQLDGADATVSDAVLDLSAGLCAIPGIEQIIDATLPDMTKFIEKMFSQETILKEGDDPYAELNSNMAAAIQGALAEFAMQSPVTFSAEVAGTILDDATGLGYGGSTQFYANDGVSGCQVGELDPTASLEIYPPVFPTFEDLTPVSGLPYDLAIALSPTALNQFFRAQAECGLLPDQELGAIDFGDGLEAPYVGYIDNHIPGFGELHAYRRVGVRVKPTIAPVVTDQPGPSGELLEMRIAGYMLEMYEPSDPELVYVAAAISGRFGVDVNVVGGALQGSVSSPSPSDLSIEVFGGTIDAQSNNFATMLPSIVAPVLQTIQTMYGNFPLPLPQSLPVQFVEVSKLDGHAMLYFDLVAPVCGSDYETGTDGMCYSECDEGFEGDNGTCWEDCPTDFVDTTYTCHHDLEIVAKESVYRGGGTLPTCASGQEHQGGFCYQKCPSGHTGSLDRCYQKCPSGYKDDGAFCRKDAIILAKRNYYRGSGTPMICASSEELKGGFCYKKCKSGYKGIGNRCYKNCPSGYKDDGLTCRRNARTITKSTSGCPWYNACCKSCPSGYRDDGCFCTRDARIVSKSSYYRGSGKSVRYCPSGTEKRGALCYKRCKSGYTGSLDRCYQNCPSGYKDDGAFCRKDAIITAKHSYWRGSGDLPSSCSSSKELEDGLCYPECEAGWDGQGLYCYRECASKYTDDGLFCRIDDTTFVKDFYPREGFYP